MFVFRDAEHARLHNQKVSASSDASLGIAGDIEIPPFSINPPPGAEPSTEETVGRFYHYPLEYTSIIKGINFLLRDDGINVLNLCLGPADFRFDPDDFRFDPDDLLQIATRHAYQAGVPVVVAAGNDGTADGTLQPLAQAPWVIAVGATDSRRALLETTSRGRPDGPFPTVVTFGHPEVRYNEEGIPEFGSGTSFFLR